MMKRVVHSALISTLLLFYAEAFSIHNGSNGKTTSTRNDFLTTIASSAATVLLPFPQSSNASEEETTTKTPKTFTRIKQNQFAYTIELPMEPTPTNKPLQTHLDEVNLPMNIKGYTYGITVDPIRITSLRDFGTPNEVAAKIVMAELRRDGVLDIKMGRDPVEDEETGGYDVEYVSSGTRGVKHFVTRTIVKNNKLYVLTAQVKQDDWNSAVDENEVWKTVQSFTTLDPK